MLAGALDKVSLRGELHAVAWRPLSEAERRQVLAAYRRQHPFYAPAILRMLATFHGFSGDPTDAVARELPMLALELAGSRDAPATATATR